MTTIPHEPPPVAAQQRAAVVRRLYHALINDELLTRSALSTDARVSGTVVGNVIQDLRWRRVLQTPEAAERGLRGPKTRYRLDPDQGGVLAIGFGHDRLGVAVTNLAGEIVGDAEGECDFVGEAVPGKVERDPSGALEQAVRQARAYLDRVVGRPENLVGVGVSLPAPLMKGGGRAEEGRLYAGFMDAWQPRDVAADLRRLLSLPESCPVVLANDANLIALREYRRGAARGVSHACVIKWGAGLGAGLILGGEVYEGPRGLAGEIGHVMASAGSVAGDPDPDETLPLFEVPEGERMCPRCAQACLEALISSAGIVKHLAHKARQEKRNVRFERIEEVIDAALDGDDEAREALRQAAHLLGHKLGPIVSVLNVQRVVVDAFADARVFDLIVDKLRDGLEHRMTPAAFQQVTVRVAATDQRNAILGAADLVLDKHLGNWVGTLPALPPDDDGNGAGPSTDGLSGRD